MYLVDDHDEKYPDQIGYIQVEEGCIDEFLCETIDSPSRTYDIGGICIGTNGNINIGYLPDILDFGFPTEKTNGDWAPVYPSDFWDYDTFKKLRLMSASGYRVYGGKLNAFRVIGFGNNEFHNGEADITHAWYYNRSQIFDGQYQKGYSDNKLYNSRVLIERSDYFGMSIFSSFEPLYHLHNNSVLITDQWSWYSSENVNFPDDTGSSHMFNLNDSQFINSKYFVCKFNDFRTGSLTDHRRIFKAENSVLDFKIINLRMITTFIESYNSEVNISRIDENIISPTFFKINNPEGFDEMIDPSWVGDTPTYESSLNVVVNGLGYYNNPGYFIFGYQGCRVRLDNVFMAIGVDDDTSPTVKNNTIPFYLYEKGELICNTTSMYFYGKYSTVFFGDRGSHIHMNDQCGVTFDICDIQTILSVNDSKAFFDFKFDFTGNSTYIRDKIVSCLDGEAKFGFSIVFNLNLNIELLRIENSKVEIIEFWIRSCDFSYFSSQYTNSIIYIEKSEVKAGTFRIDTDNSSDTDIFYGLRMIESTFDVDIYYYGLAFPSPEDIGTHCVSLEQRSILIADVFQLHGFSSWQIAIYMNEYSKLLNKRENTIESFEIELQASQLLYMHNRCEIKVRHLIFENDPDGYGMRETYPINVNQAKITCESFYVKYAWYLDFGRFIFTSCEFNIKSFYLYAGGNNNEFNDRTCQSLVKFDTCNIISNSDMTVTGWNSCSPIYQVTPSESIVQFEHTTATIRGTLAVYGHVGKVTNPPAIIKAINSKIMANSCLCHDNFNTIGFEAIKGSQITLTDRIRIGNNTTTPTLTIASATRNWGNMFAYITTDFLYDP